MGNFEKLVVLTVLFLSAVVLAISLNDGKSKGPGSPLESARALKDGTKNATAETRKGVLAKEADTSPAKKANAGLLSAEVTPRASSSQRATVQPERTADGRLRILDSSIGLAGAGIDDYKVYTAGSGDTWAALSERFYGTGRYVSLLRHANEDMMRPLEGETILVPVYDFAEEAGQRGPLSSERRTPEVRLGAADPSRSTTPSSSVGLQRSALADVRQERSTAGTTNSAGTPAANVDWSGVATYEVRPGDSLSTIAQRVYGSGSRWNVLFEANRELLKSPDWLQVGMRLQVPRGQALQSLTAAVKRQEASSTSSAPSDSGKKKNRVR